MSSHLNEHFRNIFPIFVDILEHYVAQLTGEKALQRLRWPYEEEDEAKRRAAERIACFVCALNKTQEQFPQLREIPSVQIQIGTEFVHILENFEQEIDTEKLKTSLTPLLGEELAGRVAQALGRNLVACSDSSLTERFSAIKLDEILAAIRENIQAEQNSQAQHSQIGQETLEILRKIEKLLENIILLPSPQQAQSPTTPQPVTEWQLSDFQGLEAFNEQNIGGLLQKLGLSGFLSPTAGLGLRKRKIVETLNESVEQKQAILLMLPYLLECENCQILSGALRQLFSRLAAAYPGEREIKAILQIYCNGPVAGILMSIMDGTK